MHTPTPNTKPQKRIRQRLRNNPTPWEHTLWQYLKNSQVGGFKFRRQHGIENYIVDFYCQKAKLVVELDGSGYYNSRQI